MSDPTSYANFEEISVTELSLNLEVDFTRKILKGVVTYTVEAHVDVTNLVSKTWKVVSIVLTLSDI